MDPKKKQKPQRPPPQPMSEHHRRPRSLGGKSTPENISLLPMNKHKAWHVIAKNHPPPIIAKILSKNYLDPD